MFETRILVKVPEGLIDPFEITYRFVEYHPPFKDMLGIQRNASFHEVDLIGHSSVGDLKSKLEKLKEAFNKPVLKEYYEIKEIDTKEKK